MKFLIKRFYNAVFVNINKYNYIIICLRINFKVQSLGITITSCTYISLNHFYKNKFILYISHYQEISSFMLLVYHPNNAKYQLRKLES
jgi:hypothetical protein